MASIINPPPGTSAGLDDKITGSSGRNAVDVLNSQPQRSSQTGIWVAMCAITMTFAALSSALIVRKGSTDWQHLDVPWLLYANTLVLLASSVTFKLAKRHLAAKRRSVPVSGATHPTRWLDITLGLGLVFILGQVTAWHSLAKSGLYISTNPSSSFFYVLTATHAAHLFGGICGLLLVIYRLHKNALRRRTLKATSYYWHFMGILWLYLLILLRTQL